MGNLHRMNSVSDEGVKSGDIHTTELYVMHEFKIGYYQNYNFDNHFKSAFLKI